MPFCCSILLAAALLPGPDARFVSAQTPAVADAQPFHTRGADADARSLIARAMAGSPTVARLVTELEASDLIVVVQVGVILSPIGGETRLLAAAGGARHVRVRIQSSSPLCEQITVLGHELRHAAEIAASPEIRDSKTLEAFYRRVGYKPSVGGSFETDAAVAAGLLVAREVSRGSTK
jgi:hypothetical protein